MSKKILSRDEILGAQDLTVEEVEVAEWGGSVRLRVISASELIELGNGEQEASKFMARVLSLCLVDADGKRLFSDSDMDALGSKSARVLKRLLERALKLNGLDQGAEEQAKKD